MNRIRYRGYYYDAETGLYYVSSRYYDPEVGRFISADTTDVLSVSSDLYDKNLYAYCDNNPVMREDIKGDYWETALDVASWSVTLGETIADPQNPWNWVALIGDTIDLATPIAGLGEALKAYKIANKTSGTISITNKIDNGINVIKNIHGNSLKSNKLNFGYALVNKNDEIVKFGETINPARRYTKKYLVENGYKMKIIDIGNKSYIHKWQYDMNQYYKATYNRFPCEIKGEGW